MAFTTQTVTKSALRLYVGDIDEDGLAEIVYCTYDGDIICQDEGSGTHKWTYSTNSFPFDLCVFDIDNDGSYEILVPSADASIYAINSNGTERWVYEPPGAMPVHHVTAGSFSGTIRIFASGAYQYLWSLSDNGSGVAPTLKMTKVTIDIITGRALSCLRCFDVDSDGAPELVFGANTGRVVAYDYSTVTEDITLIWLEDLTAEPSGVILPMHLSFGEIPFYGKVLIVASHAYSFVPSITILDAATGNPIDDTYDFFSFSGAAWPFVIKSCLATTGRVTVTANDIIVMDGPNIRLYHSTDAGVLTLTESAVLSANLTKQVVVFNDIFLYEASPYDCVYLSSGIYSGDNRIYKLEFDSTWTTDVTGFSVEGRLDTINDYIAGLATLAESKNSSTRINDRTFSFLAAGGSVTAGTLDEMKSTITGLSNASGINYLNTTFGSDTFKFSYSWGAGETGFGTTWGVGWPSQISGHSSPTSAANLVELAAHAESLQKPFWIVVGAQLDAYISPETLDLMLAACPTYCMGVRSFENDSSTYEDTFEFFDYFFFSILDVCLARGKKAHLGEKFLFWLFVSSMSIFSSLFDGTYRGVLQIGVEDSNQRGGELEFAARMGLAAGNIISTHSERFIEDEWRWGGSNNSSDYGTMVAHVYYRQAIRAAMCGCTDFEIKSYWSNGANYSFLGELSIKLFLTVIDKGILSIPQFSDLKNICPIKITMTEPDTTFLNECTVWGGGNAGEVTENSNASFGHYAEWWAASNLPDYNIPKYVLGQERFATSLIPSTKYGLTVVIPAVSNQPSPVINFQDEIKTNGNTITYKGVTYNATDGKVIVEALMASAVNSLPFKQNPNDRVFMQCYIRSSTSTSTTYDMVVMDSAWNDAEDQTVTLTVNQAHSSFSVLDKLRDTYVATSGNTFTLDLPAAGLFILSVTVVDPVLTDEAGRIEFYTDYFTMTAEAGVASSRELGAARSVIALADIQTFVDDRYGQSAKNSFYASAQRSYETIFSNAISTTSMQESFNALAKYINDISGMNVSDYLSSNGIKVSPTYANLSQLFGEPIDTSNIL